MKQVKRLLAWILTLVMVCNLIPAGVLATASGSESLSAIVHEGFEVGETFVTNTTTGVAMSKEYYGNYVNPGPYAAVWNDAQPVQGSYLQAYWDSAAKYGTGTDPFDIPSLILSGGVATGTDGNECISAEINAKGGKGQNGRAFINYNLYADAAAMAQMEDGATYIASVMFKSSATTPVGGGKASLRVVTAPCSIADADIICKTDNITRTEAWTELTLEFTYREEYRDDIIIQVFTGNGNDGTLYLDDLKVEKKEAAVSVSDTAVVGAGETITLSAAVRPSGATVIWESDDEAVATVDANGVVTGVAAGTAVITASIDTEWGTASDTCTVTVEAADYEYVCVFKEEFELDESFVSNTNSGILMNQKYFTNSDGEDSQYEAGVKYPAVWNKAQPKEGSYIEAYWDTTTNYYQDFSIPSLILSGGETEPANPEDAFIIANMRGANGKVLLNYNLYQNAEAMSKLEDGETYVISVMYKHSSTGGKATLGAVRASVPTSDQVILRSAAVDRMEEWTKLSIEFIYEEEYKNDLIIQIVTGAGNGGMLYLDSLKMVKKTATVEQVQLDFAEAYMETGDILSLNCTLKPVGITSPLAFVSSDPTVATVDQDGKITAVAEGKAVITVTAENGEVSETCTIIVVDEYVELTGVNISKQTLNVNPGYQEKLTVTKTPENATENRVKWESTDETIVRVDENGNIAALTAGTAQITATVGDFSDTCTVTVTDADGFSSASQDADVAFGGTKAIDLSDILEGSYTVLSDPAKGKAVLAGSILTYTASAELKEDQKGEYIDKIHDDQVVIAVANGEKTALITLNIHISKLGDLFYDENNQWIGDVTLLMTEAEYEAIMLELQDQNSLRYQLLLELVEHADKLMTAVPVAYTKPAATAKTSYDTNQSTTGDYTATFLMAYLFTKDLSGFEAKNEAYLEKTIQWLTASLQYPFWGTRGYQNQDVAASHQIVSVSLAYHWLKEELKDVRIDHTMGTDGSTEEKWNETVQTENLPILEAIEKRLWQVGSDMYSRNLSGVVYTNNHINFRMNGLLMAATVLRQMEGLTAEQQQILINWTGEALFKQARSMESLQKDGTSHEGVNFWGYGGVYIIQSNILAEDNLGFNLMEYYQLYKDSADYILYNTLSKDNWNVDGNGYCWLNFGDTYMYQNHGISENLRYLAALYGDTTAQWLAGVMEEKGVSPLNSSQWLSVIVADPNVEAIDPAESKLTTKWFQEIELVISRSDWSGNESIFAMKTGTPAGKTLTLRAQSGDFKGVVDAGHSHPDANHITLYANGEFLLRDDGVVDKYTSNHNTLLVNGNGQAGDRKDYTDEQLYINNNLIPNMKVVESNSTYGFDYIVGDATDAYILDAPVKLFERNVVYLKNENVLLVVDNVQTSRSSQLELRWFPGPKSVFQMGGHYRMIGQNTNMDFYAFTGSTQTTFENVTAYGYGGTSYNEKTFRQTYTGTAWQNAVAFSWNKTGEETAAVVYVAGDNANEHKFCVNGKIYTINVSTNTVSVTEGQLSDTQTGAADDSSLAAIVLNGELFEGFDPTVTEYAKNLNVGSDATVNVEAFAYAEGAQVNIKTEGKKVIITCKSRDGSSTTVYTLVITNYGKLTIVGAESDVTREDQQLSSSYDGIVSINNNGPHWTVSAPENGKIHVTYDFGGLALINQVDIAMQNSKTRVNYYDLRISKDGVNWTTVQENYGIEATADISANNHAFRTVLENAALEARYLQIVLRGNISGTTDNRDKAGVFSGINEIAVLGTLLYDVVIESEDNNAQFEITGEKDHYESGDKITVTAKVPEGKKFVKWIAEGVTLEDETAQTITVQVSSSIKLTAVYAASDNTASSPTGDPFHMELLVLAGVAALAVVMLACMRKKNGSF